ncbi:MAG: MAG4270 family putative restriction endonuclease [Alphaproteobacteria bacterium]
MNKPHFIVKKNLQKTSVTGKKFSDVVTPKILEDVCLRITGSSDCSYSYVDNDYADDFLAATYNKGRMALMFYNGVVHYITFSEEAVDGRNSSVQSIPTAFNLYFNNKYPNKKLYYYFLNIERGNLETDYHLLIYRLMSTLGFNFLNSEVITNPIKSFTSIEDIMYNRKVNSGQNKSNNSSYVTKNEQGTFEIYAKTYGANKYESSLICYAAAKLIKPDKKIDLIEVSEQDLEELPKSSLEVIKKMGVFNIIPSDMTLEKKIFNSNINLRSPRYIFNLLEKLGEKRCALCNCEIPELIQGAHIWPVSNIKKNAQLSLEEKIKHAINKDNGIWLCENHHKMFDEHIISFDNDGKLFINNSLRQMDCEFINDITPCQQLPASVLTKEFLGYLQLRNSLAL